jgi:hypothetical protein
MVNGTADGNLAFRTGSSTTERLRITSAGLVRVPDGSKFTAGSSDDLQIYHDGSWNYIQSHNSKNFVIQVNNNENAFVAVPDGEVQIYHNNVKKFETTTSGVAIHEDTDKVVRFTGAIGEIGDVTGFQASNTAGNALTDLGMRGTTLRFATGSAERLRIDSAGNMGLGTNNPNDQTSGGYTSFTINDSSGGIIDLRRGDVALSGGRLVGLQHEFGIEARSQNSSSQISFYVNNAYTGRWTTNGLCFGNDTAAANALDDYEEGTWTPTCASASSVSYSNQYGRYTKVGNCITIWWDLIWTSLSGGNNARIGGLPYTPVANTNQGGYGSPTFRDASGTNSENRIYGNSSYFSDSGIKLQHYNSSGNPILGSFAGSGRITGWGQYFDNNAY